ncbi:hypothetical protein [Nocardioides sp. J54]|uniref:hypothetical protein n=1 Tax=Nocardioides sp. J54 TaxID=935866 RepID=UPI00048C35B7|nr:hypothetical protein [Nocardioides sp. J54]
MARVRNVTGDTLSLFRTDAPPVAPGDEVTVRDENFVDRAWPKSTWELVEPPALEGYVDASTDEAHLWAEPEALPDLPESAYAEDATPLPAPEPKRARAKKES